MKLLTVIYDAAIDESMSELIDGLALEGYTRLFGAHGLGGRGQKLNTPVFPGVNKAVLLPDAGAGRFDVTGQASTPVNLAFTSLPTNLANGGNNLPVAFSSGYNTANSAAGATSFAPGSGASTSLSGTGALFVFLGGTVTPAVNQAAGTYTGTVTLQVTY